MKKVFFIILTVCTLGVILTSSYLLNQKKPLPVYGAFPGFKLTEKNGKQVSLEEFKGKVWIADFIFTRCSGQCPMMSGKMFQLQEKFKDIHLASFTVDPDHDTPEKLSEYAKICNADPGRWLFFTGPQETLNSILTGLHMSKLGDPMMHSASFVLVDKENNVRGYYDTNDPARIIDLKKDVQVLLG